MKRFIIASIIAAAVCLLANTVMYLHFKRIDDRQNILLSKARTIKKLQASLIDQVEKGVITSDEINHQRAIVDSLEKIYTAEYDEYLSTK